MKRRSSDTIGITIIGWCLWALVAWFALALICASLARAQEPSRCELMADVAKHAMGVRQAGVDASQAYKMVNAPELKRVVEMAYSRPRMFSERYREEAISDFTNEVFFMCEGGVL